MRLKSKFVALPSVFLRNIPQLRTLVLKETGALINIDARLMLIWSPKSACTAAYVWFAQISGFGDEIRDSNKFPHFHRKTYYRKSDLYTRSLKAPLEQFRILRIIRDPYVRAVSMYRHALKNSFSQPYMSSFSRGVLNRKTGYSFQDFLSMLESISVDEANAHFQPQFRSLERLVRPDAVINISNSDLFTQLAKVEKQWSLPSSNMNELDWFLTAENKRNANEQIISGEEFDYKPFDTASARGRKPFPAYMQLLTATARLRIERIYAVDFAAYRRYL